MLTNNFVARWCSGLSGRASRLDLLFSQVRVTAGQKFFEETWVEYRVNMLSSAVV